MSGKLSGVHHLIRIPGFAHSRKGLGGVKACNMAVFREDVVRVNGYDENFIGWGREDSDFAARLLKCGLKRKVPPFSAVVYHLWHPENSRDNLSRNDEILRSALGRSGYVCRDGLVKMAEGEVPSR
jgi:predicted glycosyltransferase involved in capsule biosynthesis